MEVYMWLKLVILVIILSSRMIFAVDQLAGAEFTPIDKWRPIEPGNWIVRLVEFGPGDKLERKEQKSSACPHSSSFFLESFAPIKIGEAGCQFHTYRISERQFHIAGYCKKLGRGEHLEVTTLSASEDGRSFSSSTTWATP